jgi:hypothetical protein
VRCHDNARQYFGYSTIHGGKLFVRCDLVLHHPLQRTSGCIQCWKIGPGRAFSSSGRTFPGSCERDSNQALKRYPYSAPDTRLNMPISLSHMKRWGLFLTEQQPVRLDQCMCWSRHGPSCGGDGVHSAACAGCAYLSDVHFIQSCLVSFLYLLNHIHENETVQNRTRPGPIPLSSSPDVLETAHWCFLVGAAWWSASLFELPISSPFIEFIVSAGELDGLRERQTGSALLIGSALGACRCFPSFPMFGA